MCRERMVMYRKQWWLFGTNVDVAAQIFRLFCLDSGIGVSRSHWRVLLLALHSPQRGQGEPANPNSRTGARTSETEILSSLTTITIFAILATALFQVYLSGGTSIYYDPRPIRCITCRPASSSAW